MTMANIANRQPKLNAGQTNTGCFQNLGGVKAKHKSKMAKTEYHEQ